MGISPDAARKRLERGTLRGEKRGGRWRVYLDPDATLDADQDAISHARRTPADAVPDSTPELVTRLESEVTFLRGKLASRTEEIRRRDHIIAGLVERVKELPTGETSSQRSDPGTLQGDQTDVVPDSLMGRLRRWLGR